MQTRWEDWTELLLGIWLFFSPWLLGYFDVSAAATNAYFVGIAIIVLSTLELVTGTRWEEWGNLVLGGWLIISPWVLGVSTVPRPTHNAVALGVILALLSLRVVVRQTQRA